jgi:hypothetical protein
LELSEVNLVDVPVAVLIGERAVASIRSGIRKRTMTILNLDGSNPQGVHQIQGKLSAHYNCFLL